MKPIIVSKPAPMVKIRVIVLKDYVEKSLKTLQDIGTLHIEKSEELSPIDRAIIEQGRKSSQELLSFVNDMLTYIPQEEIKNEVLENDITVIYTRPYRELEKDVNLLYSSLSSLHKKTAALNEEVIQLKQITKYLESFSGISDLQLKDLNFSGKHLSSRTIVIADETYEVLSTRLKPYILTDAVSHIGNEAVFYLITRTDNLKNVQSVITDSGGRILNIPSDDISLAEFLNTTKQKILGMEAEASKLREVLHGKVKENLKNLILMRGALIAENERFVVLEKACQAKYVTLIEGWLPDENLDDAISGIKNNIENAYIDSRKPTQTEEPPSKQSNMSGVKPFQSIIALFGIPKYREWDPTPIVAYSFALFFALMSADVIYGIGLILAVKFFLHKFVDNPNSDGFKLFQKVLIICGIAGIISGALSGSYLGNINTFFGIKSLAISPLVEKWMSDPILFIILGMAIGTVHVNIAHVIAFIYAIRQKAIGPILNKLGLFTLQIFGIPLVIQMMANITLPGFPYDYAMYGLGLSILLLVTSTVIQSKLFGVIMWVFDLTGVLGDIMSYCRLAGVGLSSYYLATTINLLAKLLPQIVSKLAPNIAGTIIGIVIAAVILIAGHLLTMFLAPLGGFIHSMRLCFVEFLLKFYDGSGRVYSPFRLKRKAPAIMAD